MTLVEHLLAALRRNRNRSAALRQLRRMPLHQLADIGIAPSQIEEAVDGMLAQARRCDGGLGSRPPARAFDRPARGVWTASRVLLPAGLPR